MEVKMKIERKVKDVEYYEVYGREFESKHLAEEYVEKLESLLNHNHVVVQMNPIVRSDGLDEKKSVKYLQKEIFSFEGEKGFNKLLIFLQLEVGHSFVYLGEDNFHEKRNFEMKDLYPRYKIDTPKKFESIEEMLEFFDEHIDNGIGGPIANYIVQLSDERIEESIHYKTVIDKENLFAR